VDASWTLAALLLLGGFGGAAWGFFRERACRSRLRAGARRRALLAAAAPYGGRFHGEAVELVLEGVHARLTAAEESPVSAGFTRLECSHECGGRLRVAPRLIPGAGTRFGARFDVACAPPAFAARALAPRARAAFLQLAEDAPVLEARGGRVVIQVQRCLPPDAQRVSRFLRAADAILEGLLPGAVRVIDVADEAGRCPTCGVPFDAAARPCPLCGTRQHADCWDFVGACATYGCQGRDRVRAWSVGG
jgi:hypothetical protein